MKTIGKPATAVFVIVSGFAAVGGIFAVAAVPTSPSSIRVLHGCSSLPGFLASELILWIRLKLSTDHAVNRVKRRVGLRRSRFMT